VDVIGRRMHGRSEVALMLAALISLGGCATAPPLVLPAPVSAPPAVGAGRFQAGFARVDITPPPGPGLMGYGPEARAARGYRGRLYVRATVLEDARGEKLAIVAADLLAPSAALHREVARRVVQSTGIGADRLILTATHTHSGPGHYFAVRGLDQIGSTVAGFDTTMLGFLASRVADAVHRADADRAPARAAWSVTPLWEATRIRSPPAHRRNDPVWTSEFPAPPDLPYEQRMVDPGWAMLRVDVLDSATGSYLPRGAISIFAIHGTGMTAGNDLFDADVHGVVSREIERFIDSQRPAGEGFERTGMHLFLNGAEGDVSALWTPETRCPTPTLQRPRRPSGPRAPLSPEAWVPASPAEIARCVAAARDFVGDAGTRLAGAAIARFTALGPVLSEDLSISRAFDVLRVEEHPELCLPARTGTATAVGPADGHTRFLGWELLGVIGVGLEEGGSAVGRERGCDGVKKPLLGPLFPLAFGDQYLPQTAQLMVARIGGMLIATIPGEPTTNAGASIRAAVESSARQAGVPFRHAAVVGLANGYIQYIATEQEYGAQYYEGSSTIFGPKTARVLARVLAGLAATLPPEGTPSPIAAVAEVVAYPDRPSAILPVRRLPPGVTRRVASQWRGDTLVIAWNDQRPGEFYPSDGPVLELQREAGGGWHHTTWDDDHEMEIRWLGGGRWEARWTPCSREPGAYRAVLMERPGVMRTIGPASVHPAGRVCRRAGTGG
jgi:neutral ceramidase